MRHYNSVFHDVLKWVPWGEFERLVSAHQADYRVRRLPTKAQFIALLYGQLSGAASLREIVGGLESHAARLYHVGGRPVSRSTLSDANAQRPSAVFADLFAAMVAQAQRGLRRAVGDAVYLIDSTGVRLGGQGADWARFSAKACGVKVHVVYDAGAERPIYAAGECGQGQRHHGGPRNADRGRRHLRVRPRLLRLRLVGRDGRRRLPHRHSLQAQHATDGDGRTREVPDGGAILSDRIGLLPQRQAKNRTNPFSDPVREVQVRMDDGKVLRILSNDLDASAQEIADLYKRRWAIELFFRYVKQTLKIRHLIGTSENAVRIQIAVALIAYLLLQMARAAQTAVNSPLAFARLVRANLMHRRRIDRLSQRHQTPPDDTNQMTIQWAPA